MGIPLEWDLNCKCQPEFHTSNYSKWNDILSSLVLKGYCVESWRFSSTVNFYLLLVGALHTLTHPCTSVVDSEAEHKEKFVKLTHKWPTALVALA